MTTINFAAYAGRSGVLKGDTLPVAVIVQEARLAYGVLRLLVFNELGSAMVNADRVTLDPALGAPKGEGQ